MRSIINISKKLLATLFFVIMVALFVIVVSTQSLISNNSNSAQIQTTKRKCVPTPTISQEINLKGQIAPTPTNGFNTSLNTQMPNDPFVTFETRVLKVNDLATDTPDRDKTYVYVMHCDGTIELFKVKATGNLSSDVPLLPDDFIYNWIAPASLMGSHPPSQVSSRTPTPSLPISAGYPPPTTPTVTPTATQTPVGYP